MTSVELRYGNERHPSSGHWAFSRSKCPSRPFSPLSLTPFPANRPPVTSPDLSYPSLPPPSPSRTPAVLHSINVPLHLSLRCALSLSPALSLLSVCLHPPLRPASRPPPMMTRPVLAWSLSLVVISCALRGDASAISTPNSRSLIR